MDTEYINEYAFAQPYISAGEFILWKGKPEKGSLLTAQDVFLIPFSIFWCGFAIFWTVTAATSGGLFALFGIPFVCVGLYILVGRFFWTAYMRKNTYSVITSQKIIRKRGNRVDMLDGKSLPAVHVTVHKNGCGTIRFGEVSPYNRNSFDPNQGLFVLENIPNVASVQQLLSRMER